MRALNLIKSFFFNIIIFFAERVIDKKKNYWIFGMDDGGGSRFSGNAWYMLNYVIDNHPEVQPICCTNNDRLIDILEKRGITYYRPHTLDAVKWALISKVYLICGELHYEIPNFSKRDSFMVNLWHGVPLKKIFYGSPKMMERFQNRSARMKFTDALKGRVELEEYDGVVYTSRGFKNIMKEAFNNDRLLLTGQPRDDIFYQSFKREKFLEEHGLQQSKGKTIVTYLPTFRDSKNKEDNYKIFADNRLALNELKENNIVLIQKDHNPLEKKNHLDDVIIHLADTVDTQELLMITDVLITDYSSVYIDYLHTKRPIIFYPYDLESYISNDRGIYFDYYDDKITPGPRPLTEEELLKSIVEFKNNPNKDLALRERSLDFFQEHQDGKNSMRVVKEIKERIAYV